MTCTALRLVGLVLCSSLLNVSDKAQGLELQLERHRVSTEDQNRYSQLTCEANGNGVTIVSLAVVWVQHTGVTIDLLTITTSNPVDDVSRGDIRGNGTLENNTGYIFLDQLDAATCDSSHFLCELVFTTSSGEKGRSIATDWPRSPHGTKLDSSSYVAHLGNRLDDTIAALRGLNRLYEKALENNQEALQKRENLNARISELQTKISSFSAYQCSAPCSSVTEAIANLERRLERMENKSRETAKLDNVEPPKPIVCERGINERVNESFVILTDDILGREIRCDTQTDGGGWIVFQRRVDGDVDFSRNWNEYRDGFGNLSTSFWLGNEDIHKLTNSSDYELRIDLHHDGEDYHAEYTTFKIEDESDLYRLRLGSHSGTTGDPGDRGFLYSNNVQFSTFDRDNDKNSLNCAEIYRGAWWHKSCHNANLNGQWGVREVYGVYWGSDDDVFYPTFTEMKVRKI